MHLSANLSMMFFEVPMVERLALAGEAGFASVEIQFPEDATVPALARASAELDLPVTLINVPRGVGDEVGMAALPGRQDDFRAAMETCAAQARTLRVAKTNILSGRPQAGADRETCLACLTDNLRRAGDLFGAIDVKVMVEPVNPVDVPGFFLTSLDEALEALERAAHPNLFLQFDFYHMAITEPDLVAAIRRAGPCIGHVQFADTPGRHEPGTGTIDFAAAMAALKETGYHGAVSAEYRPKGETLAGLGWMKDFREMME
ncbi:TIM barrel protein [Chelativorans sp. ZYF759]|uniref:hydroxypyruvate isomerase family protein n=1 Tax=Chelativorans sp. ZYF759 TaxID=2692213 RepID=UPI00145E0EC6|nr:TIM barrel protein [Chelativorans sp. ZYF759]NMG41607.1 TIM barrel protein [Chelativorans sp. ZYF759]